MASPASLAPLAMGKPLDRIEGRLKVTGGATYSYEFQPPQAAYGVLLMSAIAKGSIASIDVTSAEKAPGVFKVLTHLNAPKLKEPSSEHKSGGIRLEERMPLSDAVISFGGQYVGIVVADTVENARHAAALVQVKYAAEKPLLTKEAAASTAKQPAADQGEKLQVKKGDVGKAFRNPKFVQLDQIYTTPTETHNPMECSATVAVWEKPDQLVVYDTTQYVKGAQAILADAFGLKRENVRVICPYVGGAFGCKGPVWPHTFLAVMAAQVTGMPVKVELSRAQMFSGTGHRSPTAQRVALAATPEGKLQAILHLSESLTSPLGKFTETCGFGGAKVLYDVPAIEFGHTVYTVNVAQSSFMRAPGECPGTFAVESAIDEMAHALGLDPIAFRLANDSPNHPTEGVPFSTKHLARCYRTGAEKFGWSKRTPLPRSMREGRTLIGWGVATATYPAFQWEATVRIQLKADGTALVRCATHDLGTGAYTAFTQISADALGLEPEKVKFELGSSDYPYGPVAGGSNSTATVGSAIVLAAEALVEKLAQLAVNDAKSPLYKTAVHEVKMVAPGRLGAGAEKTDGMLDILKRAGVASVEAEGKQETKKDKKTAFQSFGAHFCEVRIDPDLPMVRVARVVSVMDCGRVINPKTGASQILGGAVMGIGMALSEETVYDPATGLPATRNLADYHVPVHADTGSMEVYFEGEPDLAFNPMGARGMGEIGITGMAAAVANAVFHATGKRIRDLPITPDKLL